MRCASCSVEIPSEFTHAFQQNECPACGDQLFDEETMGLMDDLKNSISCEVRLREESVSKIVLMLVTSYDISIRGKIVKKAKKKILEETDELNEGFEEVDEKVTVKKKIENVIPPEEREKIMAEAISKHYGVSIDNVSSKPKALSKEAQMLKQVVESGLSDSELTNNPILKEEMDRRLTKQKTNMLSGNSKVKRSG